MDKIYSLFLQFFNRAIRTIQYFPIIWKNEDWDYTYIYDLMAYKLKRIEKYLKNDTICVGSQRQSRQVKICRILLERLLEDNYCEQEWKKHEEKWGELKNKNGKKYKSSVEVIFYRDKCRTEEDKNLERKESDYLWNKEEEMRKGDLEMFWRIFKKYHRHWWV